MNQPKNYYLPPVRSIFAGVILVLVGIAFSFIGVDFNNSLGENLQRIFLSFDGILEFIFSLLMLAFKVGFIAAGYIYIKYADGIERAKLDDEGFYYREIPKGSGMSKMSIDLGALTFAPYSAIRDITYKKSFWTGGRLILTLNSGVLPLVALGVLKDKEKLEIVEIVKARMAGIRK